MDNQWSLFGLDLSRLVDMAKLALQQLFWGDGAGIRRRLYPTASLVNGVALDLDQYAKFSSDADSNDPNQPLALLFPAELSLAKTIQLPSEVEIDLAEALFFEIASHSPFANEDTCSGWRLISRDSTSITVALAIASRSSVMSFIDAQAQALETSLANCEVWTETGSALVQLEGFGDGARRALYHQRLFGMGRQLALVTLAACLLSAMPAALLAARSDQLSGVLELTELDARAAASARAEMVALEDKVLAAREFFSDRVLYDAWLNTVAELTPDSVYLTRLGLQGDRLTISGMAVNAAEYQTTLASSGLVDDLSAPSAFTRDARTGRERFTLTMRLAASR